MGISWERRYLGIHGGDGFHKILGIYQPFMGIDVANGTDWIDTSSQASKHLGNRFYVIKAGNGKVTCLVLGNLQHLQYN
jgi:hypothetical protein